MLNLSRLECLIDALFAMTDTHFDAEFLVDVLCQMLGGIDTAMLASGAAKAEHQRSEATLDVAAHMSIGQFVDTIKEGEYLTVILEETDDGLVEARQLFIGLIATGVVGGAAVEDVAAAVARLVVGNALAVAEAVDLDHERSLCVVLREGGRAVEGVRLVGVVLGGLVAVGTRGSGLDQLKLRQGAEALQYVDEVWIRQLCRCQQLAQVLDGWRYGVDEVLLALEIAAEAVGTEHLEQAEEYEEAQAGHEVMARGHLGKLLQGVVVLVDELAPQLVGIAGRRLPEERGEVVVVRAASAALEVDEEWLLGVG